MIAISQIHASCAARNDHGVLLLGPSGSGKSDLLLRLLRLHFILVADDRVDLIDGFAFAPAPLAGLLEVRGLGIMRLPYQIRARVVLAVRLCPAPHVRLPEPSRQADLNLPTINLDPRLSSSADRVAMALDCLTGQVEQVAGAFASDD